MHTKEIYSPAHETEIIALEGMWMRYTDGALLYVRSGVVYTPNSEELGTVSCQEGSWCFLGYICDIQRGISEPTILRWLDMYQGVVV